MKYKDFKDLEKEYSVPFSQEKYKDALEILNDGMKVLPKEEIDKNLFDILFHRAQMNSLSGMYNDCFKDLEYLIQRGYICPLYWSRFSEPFGEDENYIKLREKNDWLRETQQKKTNMSWEVILPDNYVKGKEYPLFINLHGDEDNISFHKEFWSAEELLNRDFIVVYVQSSQVTKHKGYSWQKVVHNNPDKKNWPSQDMIHKISEKSYIIRECYDSAYEEIRRCYDHLKSQYFIDEERVIIGGFSGGAVASIDFALRGTIPLKGVISLCASKPNSFTDENIQRLLSRGIKLVFMEGEKDLPVEGVEYMMKELKEMDIPYEYFINEEIGHWYPKDLDRKVARAVEFILG